MATQREFEQALVQSATQRATLGGGIAEVLEDGHGVLLYGHHPRGLRGIYHEQPCVGVVYTEATVRAVVLGGPPGITTDVILFELSLAQQDPQAMADHVVTVVSQYLAAIES